jgi:hypothetical protein
MITMIKGFLILLAFVMPISAAFYLASPSSRLSMATLYGKKNTLTDETVWNFRLFLEGVPTWKGKRRNESFSINVAFIEEEGYEPPQGMIRQIIRDGESIESKEDAQLTIVKSRWQLSEDPNDRKDGLWIWGLFSEPLYPYLLLSMETASLTLPGETDDYILPLRLFAQIDHRRDDTRGVMLANAELKVRELETVKADPFGAATVQLYEEVSVGRLNILAV